MIPIIVGLALLLGLAGAALAFRRRQPRRPDRQSIAGVWSYPYDGRIEWRWLCPADNVGEEGFASEQDAIVDAERGGYHVQK